MRSKSNVLLYNITAVVIGLVISGLLLLFMKVNPLDVCGQALGKIVTDQYNLGEILVKATPLIFTSLAFAFTYNANLFNIGAQGQFTMGAIIAVALSLGLQDSLPTWLLLLLVLLGSFAGGAAVGGLIGGAKAKFHANEFLVSMMSTYVITNFMDYLLRTSLQETKAEYMQTDAISSSAYLPNIIPGTRVHLGFLIAVAAAVAAWILLNKTQLGFQIRAVGKNADASRLGGISSGKIYDHQLHDCRRPGRYGGSYGDQRRAAHAAAGFQCFHRFLRHRHRHSCQRQPPGLHFRLYSFRLSERNGHYHGPPAGAEYPRQHHRAY